METSYYVILVGVVLVLVEKGKPHSSVYIKLSTLYLVGFALICIGCTLPDRLVFSSPVPSVKFEYFFDHCFCHGSYSSLVYRF